MPLDGVVPFPPEHAARYRERGYWRDRPLCDVYAEEVFAPFADPRRPARRRPAMTQIQHRQPGASLRNPWFLVGGAALGLVVGNGQVMQFTFGVFLQPVAAGFGAGRGTISSALLAGSVVPVQRELHDGARRMRNRPRGRVGAGAPARPVPVRQSEKLSHGHAAGHGRRRSRPGHPGRSRPSLHPLRRTGRRAHTAFDQLDGRDGVTAVVLTGPAFCAGGDLADLQATVDGDPARSTAGSTG